MTGLGKDLNPTFCRALKRLQKVLRIFILNDQTALAKGEYHQNKRDEKYTKHFSENPRNIVHQKTYHTEKAA